MKFIFFLLIALAFYVISLKFGYILGEDIVKFIILPIMFLVLNYAFFKMLLYYIAYYNDLMIFRGFDVIIIKSTFIRANYIEIIDMNRVTKIDTYISGIFQNIIGFGTLIIEQQREEVREFHFVPEPNKAVKILTKAKQNLLENQMVFREPKTNNTK